MSPIRDKLNYTATIIKPSHTHYSVPTANYKSARHPSSSKTNDVDSRLHTNVHPYESSHHIPTKIGASFDFLSEERAKLSLQNK